MVYDIRRVGDELFIPFVPTLSVDFGRYQVQYKILSEDRYSYEFVVYPWKSSGDELTNEICTDIVEQIAERLVEQAADLGRKLKVLVVRRIVDASYDMCGYFKYHMRMEEINE